MQLWHLFFMPPAATLLARPQSQKKSVAQIGPLGGSVASRCRNCCSCLLLPVFPKPRFGITLGCSRRCVSYMPSFGSGSRVFGSYWLGSWVGYAIKTTKGKPVTEVPHSCRFTGSPYAEHSTVASVMPELTTYHSVCSFACLIESTDARGAAYR